jgi:hypothetical protein
MQHQFNEWARIWSYEMADASSSRYANFHYAGYVRVLGGVANGYGNHLWLRRRICNNGTMDGLYVLNPFSGEHERVPNVYQHKYPDLSLKLQDLNEVGLRLDRKVVLSVELQEKMIAYCELMRQTGVLVNLTSEGLSPCVSRHQEEINNFQYLTDRAFAPMQIKYEGLHPDLLALAVKEVFQYKTEAVMMPLRDISQGLFENDTNGPKLDPLMIGNSPDACAFITSKTASRWL